MFGVPIDATVEKPLQSHASGVLTTTRPNTVSCTIVLARTVTTPTAPTKPMKRSL